MVGPYGDWVNFDLSESVRLVQEVDGKLLTQYTAISMQRFSYQFLTTVCTVLCCFAGVRIVSSTQHELLRQVPNSLVDVFKIGSTTPGETCYRKL